MASKQIVEQALGLIKDKRTGRSLIDMGWVQSVHVAEGQVGVVLEVPSELASGAAPLRAEAETALSALEGVESAQVVLTAERKAKPESSARSGSAGTHSGSNGASGGANSSKGQDGPSGLRDVASIVAIGSGKGGVGKSTTTVNLALALASQGLSVGIVDADIYGPSVPTLLGLSGKPQIVKVEGQDRFVPKAAHGVTCNSIGFLIDQDTAMAWRGPMVQSALIQLLKATNWGPLDMLLIDMPPGTGDIQLSLAQQARVDGAVIVSTPQDLALLDAKKAITLFQKTEIPILGLVENMSGYVCPHCHETSYPFGQQGAEAEATAKGLSFLGAIPLELAVRKNSDAGCPIVIKDGGSPASLAFHALAQTFMAQSQKIRPKPAPRLVMA